MKILSGLLLICFFAISSCELIVDVEVPYDGDKLVVNGLQKSDQRWMIDLSYSKYILSSYNEGGFPSVPNGSVTIYGDDGSEFQLHADTLGLFVHDSYPLPGHKYTIVARSNTSNEVRAEMVMPRAVKIKNVEWDSASVSQPNGQGFEYWYATLPLTVTFDDPAEEKNYYAVAVVVDFTVTRQYPGETQPRTDSARSFYQTVIVDPGIASEDERKTRFSDITFDGRTYTAPLEIQVGGNPDFKIHRVDVQLVSLSEDYFRYEESVFLYRETDGDPFAQPVQIYSNVQNGFGIFAGTSHDYKRWNKTP